MKSIQFYVGLLNSIYFGGPENRPRVNVFLNGYNEFANGFQSYRLSPMKTVDGQDLLCSTGDVDFRLQPVPLISNAFAGVGIPQGQPTNFRYTVTNPGLGTAIATVIPQGFNRSLLQVMQQIAEFKPIVKSIKIQYYHYAAGVPGVSPLLLQLGEMAIGQMMDPLFGDKPEFDTYDLRKYYKPDLSNSGFASPQDYLANINNFDSKVSYIELNIPINKKFDGNTMVAINAPVDPYAQIAMFVTYYI